MKPTRRELLAGALAAAALPRAAVAQAAPRKYLFVIGAMGGASIIDSFLPVSTSAHANGSKLTTFADSLIEQPNGSNLRCVANLGTELAGPPAYVADFTQRTFLERHGADVAVMTVESTSVNHVIAQQRAMNGGGINRGRTILEAAGLVHGQGLPLPVCNLMNGGYVQPGTDGGLPVQGRQAVVQDPTTFAFGTHGFRGLPMGADAAKVAKARAVRERLESRSAFGRTFGGADTQKRWLELRAQGDAVEASNLASKLMLLDDPRLAQVGLSATPELARLRQHFPELAGDTFQQQAALAFLLVTSGASAAVGFALTNAVKTVNDGGQTKIVNANLAFDASHYNHRVAQHTMWSRLLRTTDGLIRLLKTTQDPSRPGSSFWANSLVYLATDFGREKERPAANALAFGTGHHLNNGVVLVSPLVKGNRVYGGVDPATCLTHGFDRITGAPAPGTVMSEGDVYAAISGALGVDYAGRTSIPALVS